MAHIIVIGGVPCATSSGTISRSTTSTPLAIRKVVRNGSVTHVCEKYALKLLDIVPLKAHRS
jgi:hypothetical protein